MGVESLGTAALNLTVDTRGIEVGIERAKSKVAGFSNAAQAEYAKLSAVEKRRVDSLMRQADVLGLTREQQIAYNATLKTSGAIQEELLRKVAATNAAVKKGGTVFNEYGLSAKQTTAAMRQVPAHLKDIFVGLQGGQNPLTVLIQQGGQLKDVFGGVKPAAKALGAAILELVNPVTVSVAAIAGLLVALNSLEEREFQLQKAIALTGNAADISADQLRAYAASIDDSTDASQRQAERVVAQVAQTGVFTAEQIRLVATAAEQMEEATGRSIEKTIAEFASLRDGPVDAILKLNVTIGDGTNITHFLTEETLKQIRALREQGDEAGATQLAIEAYANAINDRAPEITEHMTTMAALWRGLKGAAADAVDGVITQLDRMVKATHDSAVQTGGFLNMMFRLGPNMAGDAASKHARPPPRGGSSIVDPQEAKALDEFRKAGLQFLSDQE